MGGITERYTSTGRVSGYQIEVWHDGLNEHRVFSDRDLGVLENKINAHLLRWGEKHEKLLQKKAREAQRQSGLETAEVETVEAEAALQACRDILSHTLDVDDRVNWESLKSWAPMTAEPKRSDSIKYDERTGQPIAYDPPPPPSGTAPVYLDPKLKLLDRLWSARRSRKEQEAKALHDRSLRQWQDRLDEVDRLIAKRQATYALEKQEW